MGTGAVKISPTKLNEELWFQKMLNRRRLLQSGLYTAAGASFSKGIPAVGQATWHHPHAGTQRHQTHPLCRSTPLLPPCSPLHWRRPGETIELEMGQFHQKVHRDLPAHNRVWGYNGPWPGDPHHRSAKWQDAQRQMDSSKLPAARIFFLLITRSMAPNPTLYPQSPQRSPRSRCLRYAGRRRLSRSMVYSAR